MVMMMMVMILGVIQSLKNTTVISPLCPQMVEQEYKHLDKFPFQVQFQFLPPQFIMFNKTMYRCKERPSKMKRDTKMAVPAALPKRESCPKLPSS